MKNAENKRPSENEAIEATAATWLFEKNDGLTPEYEIEFNRWMQADSRHRAAFTRLENTWSKLEELREYRPESSQHPDCDLIRTKPRYKRNPLLFTGIATLAASLLMMAGWWFANGRAIASDSYKTFTSEANVRESVTLVDGSKIYLNSHSEVRVEYTPALRRISLVRGEAFFVVAKNQARPFTVLAGAVAVHAIGTAFNVSLSAAAVDVVVSEGKVKVTEINAPESFSSILPRNSARSGDHIQELLVANESLHIPSHGITEMKHALTPKKLDEQSMRQALLWKDTWLVFKETPLTEVVERFNRHNKIQLILGDTELGTRPVGGNFHANNLEVFVSLLVQTHEISAERTDADHIILRRVR